jgi:EKC/KEOPS complex subunit PCC1/LAGE3
VRRAFALEHAAAPHAAADPHAAASEPDPAAADGAQPPQPATVLRTEYRATTNRMLRVAVNGFMESLGLVVAVMAELDADALRGVVGG